MQYWKKSSFHKNWENSIAEKFDMKNVVTNLIFFFLFVIICLSKFIQLNVIKVKISIPQSLRQKRDTTTLLVRVASKSNQHINTSFLEILYSNYWGKAAYKMFFKQRQTQTFFKNSFKSLSGHSKTRKATLLKFVHS